MVQNLTHISFEAGECCADDAGVGAPVDGLALASALWCRYCFGETESGTMIRANDPSWDRLVDRSHAARSNPAAWLGMRDVYGEVGEDERFRLAFSAALDALWRDGTSAVLKRYVAGCS